MDRYDEGMRAMRARLAAVQELLRERLGAPGPGDTAHRPRAGRPAPAPGLTEHRRHRRELFLSANTVKTHAHAIYRKLAPTRAMRLSELPGATSLI